MAGHRTFTSVRDPWPSRGGCHPLQFPSRRVGRTFLRLASLPFCLSHSGRSGPAVFNQNPGFKSAGNSWLVPSLLLLRVVCGELGEVDLMPGPMVVLAVSFLRWIPFAVWGFALKMISMMALKFTLSLSASKEALPKGTWSMPAFSTRNSTLPAFSTT